nr:YchJ family metal-binding protein [Patulibacter sp. SYSU D01012]
MHRGRASGRATAPTAERLMRSRYSAFAFGDRAYLLATWHPSTRPAALDLDDGLRWEGLDVLRTTAGGEDDRSGTVAFVARYRDAAGHEGEQREDSAFVREDGAWFYVGPVR